MPSSTMYYISSVICRMTTMIGRGPNNDINDDNEEEEEEEEENDTDDSDKNGGRWYPPVLLQFKSI